MVLVQVFGEILRLFVTAALAVVFFPLWLVIAVATCPLRIVSPRAHVAVVDKAFKACIAVPSFVFVGRTASRR